MTFVIGAPPPPLLVVVSIDTEEDNWEPSRQDIRLSNIRALPGLQRRFESFGIRPTYFTSYHVARARWAAGMLRDIAADGSAEIGAHLHPWNTPPMREPMTPANTMMKNLPIELQEEKLLVLTDAITAITGSRPRAFRAGRFGLGATGALLLSQCGYAVDSSVTPFRDWSAYNNGPDHRSAPLGVYRPSLTDLHVPVLAGPLAEVPLSLGFTRRPFSRWFKRHEWLSSMRVGKRSLASIAYRSRLVRKVQLSFETDSVRDMLTLSRQLVAEGARFLHLSWHSPSMVEGLSPFTRTVNDRHRLLANIDRYFDQLSASLSFSFATVSETADRLAPRAVPDLAHVLER